MPPCAPPAAPRLPSPASAKPRRFSVLFLSNNLLIAYSKSRLHRDGLRLLDEMPRRNAAVSWSVAIARAHAGAGRP
ncbi:pentatricopeptide repeat-containing protein [Panicum miliaceum]|uniref:Pentatricopeptide repeat-containing protein n=1 Tax=Panicum miliaceum TaxID=4540 RepID=A0A3L6TG14_PANMI|nr:pentatricopeptide repeat-containing protein [Panicum miliaceum]